MISPARIAALEALLQLKLDFRCPSAEDRHLAERIYFGTLQNHRFLDACLRPYLKTPIGKLDRPVHLILQLSAFQLLFLDRVPASAVVNDAVSLCRYERKSSACGFTNAVLRRISENRERLLSKELPAAERWSHPDWLYEAVSGELGEDGALRFMLANDRVPGVRLQINKSLISPEAYLARLSEAGVPVLQVNAAFSSVLVESGDVRGLPGYAEGLFFIQDDAARTAVSLTEPLEGRRFLDLCAAPGGKSMAAFLSGAQVTCADISESRLERCRENFQRMGMDMPVRAWDATKENPDWIEQFDVVLADVPCSGTGVIRRHPEIRCKNADILEELLPLQQRILQTAADYVCPGGILIYSTCSVLRPENEKQIEAFLTERPEFSLEGCTGAEEGLYRSWPQDREANDGFFAARCRRKL